MFVPVTFATSSRSTFCSMLTWYRSFRCIFLDCRSHLHRTSRKHSSCILPEDLSDRKPEVRYPDAADPYRRYDPSTFWSMTFRRITRSSSRICSGSGNSASFVSYSFTACSFKHLFELVFLHFLSHLQSIGSSGMIWKQQTRSIPVRSHSRRILIISNARINSIVHDICDHLDRWNRAYSLRPVHGDALRK